MLPLIKRQADWYGLPDHWSVDYKLGFILGALHMGWSTDYLCRMSVKTIGPTDFVLNETELGLLSGLHQARVAIRKEKLKRILKKLTGRVTLQTIATPCKDCHGTGRYTYAYGSKAGHTSNCYACTGTGKHEIVEVRLQKGTKP